MPKPQEDPKSAADAPPEQITVQEFCQRLSVTDKRVELIAGFYSVEMRESRFKDAEDQFRSRFEAFITKPV